MIKFLAICGVVLIAIGAAFASVSRGRRDQTRNQFVAVFGGLGWALLVISVALFFLFR